LELQDVDLAFIKSFYPLLIIFLTSPLWLVIGSDFDLSCLDMARNDIFEEIASTIGNHQHRQIH